MRVDLPTDASIEFITDIEGDWDFLCTVVARSTVLWWEDETIGTLGLDQNAFVVFGGDAQDRGPGDIRVTRSLIWLHDAYPGRVFLIAGNRDVNKLRFAAELANADNPEMVDPVTYLDSHTGRPKQQRDDFAQERGLAPHSAMTTLAWTLEKTMGAPDALDHRRAELLILGEDASDEAVLRSFLESVDPFVASEDSQCRAWTWQYLQRARILLVIGDTVFCHGAIRSRGLLRVPAGDCIDGFSEGSPASYVLDSDMSIEYWADELERWKVKQLASFEAVRSGRACC